MTARTWNLAMVLLTLPMTGACGGDDGATPSKTEADAASSSTPRDAAARDANSPVSVNDAAARDVATARDAQTGPQSCDPTVWPTKSCFVCDPEDTSVCQVCDRDTSCDKPTYTVKSGTVSSSCCGLVWQQAVGGLAVGAEPEFCNDSTPSVGCYTWMQAKAYCESLTLDGGGFRLPYVRELLSLVDDPTSLGLDNPNFPNTPHENFWAASENWGVDFALLGRSAFESGDHLYRVRCVR